MRRLMLWVMAGVAIGAVGTSGLSRLRQSDQARQMYQRELPDATPIKVGEYTESQRVHSRLFGGHALFAGKTLLQRAGEAIPNSDVIGLVAAPGQDVRDKVDTPAEVIEELSNASDAIILGVVVGKASQITDDGSFLFTDYSISVREAMKTPEAALGVGSTITVTHPGGKVLVKGVIVEALDQNSLPLPSNGNELLLFLKYIPETGAYQLAEYRGAFEMTGKGVHPLTDIGWDRTIDMDEPTLVKAARSAGAR